MITRLLHVRPPVASLGVPAALAPPADATPGSSCEESTRRSWFGLLPPPWNSAPVAAQPAARAFGGRRKGAEGLRANASGRWTRGGMAARGTAPELGARLSLDDFLIEKELARTQAGTVYKAKHGRSGKMVVLKARRSAEIGRDGSIEHEVW